MAAPAATHEPVLFQALCTPPQSLTGRSFAALVMLLTFAAGLIAALFLTLGAWPVLPILGLEVAVAAGAVAWQARAAAQRMEMVLLTPSRLSIQRRDGRGRLEEIGLDPYWARLELRQRPGHAGSLHILSRGRRIEIGRYLTAEEKAALYRALQTALAAARRPMFDNPQVGGK